MHVFRWDLDKTYLDTDIGSVRGLIRSALESAGSKRNVPGSGTLLRALTHHDPSARVHILSGSPTQMRSVLAQKLALDGIRVDSLTLKDNLRNLRRGRLRAVRGQLGYKLPRLLEQRSGLGPSVRETLFGDDSEVDALVYAVYADAIAGRVSPGELARILEAGGAYADAIEDALLALERVGRADAVEDIFIHVDRGVPISEFHRLGPRVKPVFSWMQAALVLWERGRVAESGVVEVIRSCTETAELSAWALAGLIQDAVRRRLVRRERVESLVATPPLAALGEQIHLALDRLTPGSTTEKSTAEKSTAEDDDRDEGRHASPDYLGFLRATSH